MAIRRPVTARAGAALGGGGLTAGAGPAGALPATAPPVATANATNAVRAAALPTAQIDGIAYAQVIVGDTVYVGGTFKTARPAGVAVGGAGEVTRNNLLAYSLSTGKLIDSFAPDVDNTVRALAVSPDGTRLYVGGLFTHIDGVTHYRIASFNTATNAIVTSFRPAPEYLVDAITATDKTVFFGGKFSSVSGVARSNLAAAAKDTGALTKWAPVADATVQAMVLAPNKGNVIVAGAFSKLNGTAALGLGSVRVSNGATMAFAANQVVQDYGPRAAFLSLTTDGSAVFGTAYNFSGTGNFEGTFAANPTTGQVRWIEDCHGDTYGVWSSGTTVYTVGHAHDCSTIGGFPQVQNSYNAHRAIAFTAVAEGTVQKNTVNGYGNFAGQKAPSLLQWFPTLTAGSVSGADQAGWTITGNSDYVVIGGEFPTVNGVAQQGLVRFAKTPISPDSIGPHVTGTAWTFTAKAAGSHTVSLSFPANYDADDLSLKYVITRDTGSGTPSTTVWSSTFKSSEWSLKTTKLDDPGLKVGTSYRYRISATDSSGNVAKSDFVTVTVT